MTGTRYRALLLSVPLLWLSACGSSAPPRPPVAVERAANADREAKRALRDGDLPVARNLFEQSLRLQQSLDNLPGVATAAINLASVRHLMGGDEAALSLLDGILQDKQTPYPPELRALAAFRKAVILVDGGGKDAAAAVEAAAQLCGRSCEYSAGLDNLRARMAFSAKDYVAASAYAKSAADAAGDSKEELANARRNQAAAETALEQPAQALEHYLAALDMDKQTGRTGHIAEDLAGASRALEKLGRKDEAASYARRAAAAQNAIHARAP